MLLVTLAGKTEAQASYADTTGQQIYMNKCEKCIHSHGRVHITSTLTNESLWNRESTGNVGMNVANKSTTETISNSIISERGRRESEYDWLT